MPDFVTDPEKFRKLNGWLTILWFVAAFPICIFLNRSLPFLVFISVYAVVTGHLATWQAARVEVNQEEQNDTDFEKIESEVDDLHASVDAGSSNGRT